MGVSEGRRRQSVFGARVRVTEATSRSMRRDDTPTTPTPRLAINLHSVAPRPSSAHAQPAATRVLYSAPPPGAATTRATTQSTRLIGSRG